MLSDFFLGTKAGLLVTRLPMTQPNLSSLPTTFPLGIGQQTSIFTPVCKSGSPLLLSTFPLVIGQQTSIFTPVCKSGSPLLFFCVIHMLADHQKFPCSWMKPLNICYAFYRNDGSKFMGAIYHKVQCYPEADQQFHR